MRRSPLSACLCAAALALAGCWGTVDSLGYDRLEGADIRPMVGPRSYPNALRDLLGKTDAEISARIDGVFNQLFHGDPTSQAIYVPVGADQAYVVDVLHGDIRTEGLGYGMNIAVQLDKRDEADRLWRYAKANMQVSTGASQGYFMSSCDLGTSTVTATAPCLDPFGMQQLVMALLLAHDRWGSAPPGIDYAGEAAALFNLMRHKQDENGGVVDGVTDLFDADAALPLDVPSTASAGQTRPAAVLPGYYALWAQATGDPFWSRAARAARAFWQRAAHPQTGLFPVRATFTGTPVSGWDTFEPEGYRTQINLVIDRVWTGGSEWEVAEADRLLAFFAAQGMTTYCRSYSLDGASCLNTEHEPSLVVVNGATALVATRADSAAFVQAVWDLPTPTGAGRYYAGILQLITLMILGGQYRVW